MRFLLLFFALTCAAQIRNHRIEAIPQSSTAGKFCFVGTNNNRICLRGLLAPSSNADWTWPTTGIAGTLQTDASGNISVGAGGGGGGSVTSVGLSMPTIFTVSGSPVVTSGTLTATLNTQLPNLAFMSQVSGTGVPGFRSILDIDLPAILSNKTLTGVTTIGTGTSSDMVSFVPSASITCPIGTYRLHANSAGDFYVCVNGIYNPIGNVTVPWAFSTTVGTVPIFSTTNGRVLSAGLQFTTVSTANTLVQRASDSSINVGNVVSTATSDAASIFRRFSSTQTSPIVSFVDQFGNELTAISVDGNFTGRAETAKLLSSTPTICTLPQFAYGITANGNALCSTPAGGAGSGNVTGTGPTSIGNIPTYTNTSATAIGPGLVPDSTINAPNTVITRDANRGFVAFDRGAQVYNCRAFGAIGDGTTDNRAAIQACIDALPSGGGIAYIPPGDYRITTTNPTYAGCGIVLGNGTSNNYSSRNGIKLRGVNKGSGFSITSDTASVIGSTRIKSGSGSISSLICVQGPAQNMWIEDLTIDPQGVTSIGLFWSHVDSGGTFNLHFRNSVNWSVYEDTKIYTINPTSNWAHFNCGNSHTRISVTEPYFTTTNGWRVGGVYDSGGGSRPASSNSTCSATYRQINGAFGSSAGAVGFLIERADNNYFEYVSWNSYSGSSPGAGTPIAGIQQSPDSLFPLANKFQYCPSNHSQVYGGTWGNANFVYATQTEGNALPSPARLYYLSDAGRIGLNAGSTLQSDDFFVARADATKIGGIGRTNNTEGSGNGIRFFSFDEFLMNGPGGTKPSIDRTLADLNTIFSPKNGYIFYCSNCVHGSNPCTSGGSGAIAKRLNGGWVCN